VAGMIYFIGGDLLFIIHLTPLCRRILAMTATPGTEDRISRKDLGVLALVIACGSVVAPLLLLNGLNQTTAINASLLLNAESLFTVLLAFAFLHERGEKREYIGILMLLLGVVFVATNGEFTRLTLTESIPGNALIIGACLFWGTDSNLSRLLSKKKDIILVTALKCFFGGVALLVISFLLGINFTIPLSSIPYLLSVGALSIAFSILLFLFALREIGSMRTGSIYSTSALVGAIFAFLVLREPIGIIQIAAGLLMVLGVYLVYCYAKQRMLGTISGNYPQAISQEARLCYNSIMGPMHTIARMSVPKLTL
jgi:drug/metabolite transporter (DMT)-like permease